MNAVQIRKALKAAGIEIKKCVRHINGVDYFIELNNHYAQIALVYTFVSVYFSNNVNFKMAYGMKNKSMNDFKQYAVIRNYDELIEFLTINK